MSRNNNSSGGSVFQNWHDRVMSNFSKVQLKGIYKLQKLPRFSDYITEIDVYSIENIAERFNVEIDEYDLNEPSDYFKAKGKIEAKIDKIINEELKPSDPFVEMIQNADIKMNESDLETQT